MQFRLIILALGMFVIGTDGFVIAGLLPDIARATDVTTSSAGQLITIFALVYAIASPILASALGGVERKQLLLGSLAVFVLGNVLVAVSTLYPVLLAGRVIAALGASTFTPAALVITAALATPERRGRSIALVTSGLTIATIVGVPIGSFIGAVSGFQNVFWFIVAVGVVVLVLVAWRFPPVAAPVAVDLRQRLRTLRLPGVPATIIATFVVFLSAFTVYNYIAEFFAIRAGIEGSPLSWVLLAFGVGGAIGNILGGVLSDRIGARTTMLLSVMALTAAFVMLWLGGHIAWLAVATTLFWGIAGWLLAPAQQHRLVVAGHEAASVLISLNSSAMYLGIAASGAVGGALINLVGVEQLPAAGALGALAAVLLVVFAYGSRTVRADHHADHGAARQTADPR